MKNDTMISPKQVGQRIKERRKELNLSMSELGNRIGVNKSTIQRYETDGVDPKRTMIIEGLANALMTIPDWLIGLTDSKEYGNYAICEKDLENHIKKYLNTVTTSVKGKPHQQLLTTFLGQFIDLYSILVRYFAISMEQVDKASADENLKESIRKYSIEIGSITENVYQKEMEEPIDYIKSYLDGILHLYDNGKTKVSIPKLANIVEEAEKRVEEKELLSGKLTT